jgi:hypothetical protein
MIDVWFNYMVLLMWRSPLSMDGTTLAWACKEVFGPASMASFESIWSRVSAALPELHPLVVWLANVFPNKMLKDQIRVISRLLEINAC